MNSSDRADTQSLALVGFNTDRCAHLILEVVDIAAARRWLHEVVQRRWIAADTDGPLAGAGAASDTASAVNIGFTHRGLLALGLDAELLDALQELAPAFCEGAVPRAARRLGDTLESAAEHWDAAFGADRAHVLVSVHARQAGVIRQRIAELAALLQGQTGLAGWGEPLAGEHLHLGGDSGPQGRPIRMAHFGFRDGIARPVVIPSNGTQHHPLFAEGELLLGYANAAGFDRWSRVQPEAAARFFRNGSFAAFRRVQQDEAGFEQWLHDTVEKLAAAGHDVSTEYLKAKLCGRWPNGAIVRPGETVSPAVAPPASMIDSFDFSDDPRGSGCPFGSHVRRTNPRGTRDVHDRPRPLFRRGMPYGPAFSAEKAHADRGLLGLFFCASLEDQFEHMMAEWIDKVPMGPDSRGDAKDPLAGMHDDPNACFEIPRDGAPGLVVGGFRPFLRTRGTLYALYPGLKALQVIASSTGAAVAPKAAPPKAPLPPPKPPSPAAVAAQRALLRDRPPPVSPGDLAADSALPDRYCDIVMEGGITSGVLYPPAAAELAKVYRFKSIGGSSVGAFAAAVTAAAEYRRREGYVDGFNKLRRVPELLGTELDGEARLFWMFRPQPKTRRLFNLFVATLNRGSWPGRLAAGVGAAFRQYRSWALIGALVVLLLFGSGFATHALLGIESAQFASSSDALKAAGIVALAGSAAAFLALALAAAFAAVAAGVLWDLGRGLVPNGFGLCHGGPQEAGAEHRRKSDDAPPLTVSLHELIQSCAGRDALVDPPLTFKDLWDAKGYPSAWLPAETQRRSIDLQVYATNLAHGRPYRFPLDDDDEMARLFFKPEELAPLFPARVIQHLVGYGKPYASLTPSDPPAGSVEQGIYELPREHLPIVVAARMSLSFPLLISAVPLWAIDYSARKAEDRVLRRCWFSDGGLCSNFPIHLFDSFVPRWPTFGITLQTRQRSWPHQRVWLPDRHWRGGADMRDDSDLDERGNDLTGSFEMLGSFLSRIWNATWRWNDMTLMRMPGVRDRVVRVFLLPGEGGINIRMSRDDILGLASTYGVPAAHAFIERFRDGPGWREHRWIRLNSLLTAARARLAGLAEALSQNHHAMPLKAQVADALLGSPLEGRREKPLDAPQAAELLHLIAALEQLQQTFTAAGDTRPFIPRPRPSLRVRQPT